MNGGEQTNEREGISYEEVCSGKTEHVEVLQLLYNTQRTTFEDLVRFFFTFHDPTTDSRQGNDIGTQYSSAIFCSTPEQLKTAKRVKQELQTILSD